MKSTAAPLPIPAREPENVNIGQPKSNEKVVVEETKDGQKEKSPAPPPLTKKGRCLFPNPKKTC